MIHKRSQAKLFLSKAGLGSIGTESSKRLDKTKPQLFLEESSFPDGNESTTFCKNNNTSNDTLVLGSPNALTMLQSSRSYGRGELSLPLITGKLSTRSKNSSDFQLSKIFPRNNASILPAMNQVKTFEKLVLNRNEDLTTPYFLKKLNRLFPTNIQKESKLLTNEGGIRKYISIGNAKRIIQTLVKELQAIRMKVVDEFSGSKLSLEGKQWYNEQYSSIESLDSAVTDIYNSIGDVLSNIKIKKMLEASLKDIVERAQTSNNQELFLYCIYTQGKIAMARNEFNEAISYFKQYKTLCVRNKVFENKIFAYKNLGKCYQNLKRYKSALAFFTKFLQMAWLLNSEKYELLAYDYIGKQYFYLGEIKKAALFHKRMTNGRLEPADSNLKKIGIYKANLGRDYHSSNHHPLNRLNRLNVPEEEEDDSSRDGGIGLPTPPPEEANSEKEEMFKDSELNAEGRRRKKAKEQKNLFKKNNEKYFIGLVRAELIKKQNERDLRFGPIPKKSPLDDGINKQIKLEEEKKLEEPMKASAPNLSKATEKILISHLARNRNIKNFSTRSPQDLKYGEDPEDNLHVTLGTYSEEKVKVILDKFRTNLRLIKESLEIFELDVETQIDQIVDKKGSKNRDSSLVGSKKSFLPSKFFE